MAGKEPLSHLVCRLYFSQFALISPTNFTAFPPHLSLLPVSSTVSSVEKVSGVSVHPFFYHPLLLSTFYHLIPSAFFFSPILHTARNFTGPTFLSRLFALIISNMIFDVELCVD